MKVTGFSFIKDAIKFNYPIVEAIRSIMPLCDEIVVAVGKSSDGTREMVESLGPKVRIIDTVWDESLKEGGRVLAVETDKAFQAIGADTDWCVYIQGDEVLHEEGIEEVRNAMIKWKDDKNVDGLLFKYRHFFGSYNYIGAEGHWYRHEIRVIKNDKTIYSYRDAQGFRKGKNEKLKVKPVNAYIHHYGWVQDPRIMKAKMNVKEVIDGGKKGSMEDIEPMKNVVVPPGFASSLVNALALYKGKHPAVMQERVSKTDPGFTFDLSKNKLKLKDKVKNLIEKVTGKRPFDYKNYKII